MCSCQSESAVRSRGGFGRGLGCVWVIVVKAKRRPASLARYSSQVGLQGKPSHPGSAEHQAGLSPRRSSSRKDGMAIDPEATFPFRCHSPGPDSSLPQVLTWRPSLAVLPWGWAWSQIRKW